MYFTSIMNISTYKKVTAYFYKSNKLQENF